MPKKTKLIDQELVMNAERALNLLGDNGVIAIRLTAIIASYKHGIKKVSEVYDINRSSLHRWVDLFKKGGVEKIKNISKRPRSKLRQDQKGELKKWIENDSGLTIKAIKIKIKEVFDVSIEKSSIYRMIKNLGFSHITGRKNIMKLTNLRKQNLKKSTT